MNLTRNTNTIVLILASVAAIIAVFLFVAPVPQDLAYHNFSDTRMLFGIDNFWNVSSNLPFLLVGVAGLYYIHRHGDAVCVSGLETAYRVFFIGILLTAFGSGYYHLAPGNNALVWDRLPMTIGFAGLFSIIVGEFVSVRTARRLLLPLLVVGLTSVEYWAWTEARGAGDLRPYAIVQFLPMLLIPVILLSYRPVTGTARYFWWMFAFYFAAKLFEQFDAAIFAVGHLISGHSLKHIAAALTPAVFLYALTLRRHDSRGA
ncbi:MAG: alkaline phytoceramidase [Gammaproteobacteria bacterium]|nr:MAG: alkaline phytoceramidase [Gammaproteobacteria bacterium]